MTASARSVELAEAAASAAADKLATDLAIIDVSEQLVITDCFVLASAPNERQAADHRAHLMVQEAPRFGLDVNFLADLADLQPIERLHRTVGLAMDRAEGRKVVAAHQQRCSFGHRIDVERDRDMPHAATVQRRRRAAIEYAVQILAADT